MKRYDHIPTVEEAHAAQIGNGLGESYWWVTGWNFNRPTIARLGIGAHVREGRFVWLEVGDNCPVGGFRADALTASGISFVFVGPIECPHDQLIALVRHDNSRMALEASLLWGEGSKELAVSLGIAGAMMSTEDEGSCAARLLAAEVRRLQAVERAARRMTDAISARLAIGEDATNKQHSAVVLENWEAHTSLTALLSPIPTAHHTGPH